MQILSPVLLFSAMAQIWVIQVLMPLRKDRVILISSFVGAAVGILANILLVGRLGAVGSALVLLLSELAGNLISFIYAVQKGYLRFPTGRFLIYLVGSVPYIFCCLIGRHFTGLFPALAVSAVLCLAYFCLFHFVLNKKSAVSGYLRSFITGLR